MPYQVVSTRPASGPSRRNPERESERIKRYAKNMNELVGIISLETIDADRITITPITELEFREKMPNWEPPKRKFTRKKKQENATHNS